MLKGHGLLSLWNGVEPGRLGEYNLWHTREHVPERLVIPGMLRARRYHRGEGPLLEFLTLYELESNAVLASAPYRALLETPTSWSRSRSKRVPLPSRVPATGRPTPVTKRSANGERCSCRCA